MIAPVVHNCSVFLEHVRSLSALDRKIYNCVVARRLLQIAAVGLCAGSVAVGFLVTPWALLGALPAVALFALGMQKRGSVVLSTISKRPVGLDNHGNDCWLNASLQLLFNVPHLEKRAYGALLPSFKIMAEQYHAAQDAGQVGVSEIKTKDLRAQLSILTGNAVRVGSFQEDSVVFFQRVLGFPTPLYQWSEHLNGVKTAGRSDGIIRLATEADLSFSFEKAFKQFFDSVTTLGQRIELFFDQLPQDLVLQIPRSYQRGGEHGKIERELAIPENITLPKEVVLTGEGAEYACDGFIEHIGSSIHSGHYVAYVKKGSQWWLCNDASVSAVSLEEARAAMRRGYIYHFLKK